MSKRDGRPADDLVQPFQVEPFGLRGRVVRLGPVVDDILSRHDYPQPVATLLGESMALAAVLAAALKYDGIFTLQARGDGPISVLVADVTNEGDLRGFAAYDADAVQAAVSGPVEGPVPQLLGAGNLVFTVDQGPETERYQGVVDIAGATLAECAHHYFRQSEQLETGIRLQAGRVAGDNGGGGWRAGGIMIQRLPHNPDAIDAEEREDGWRRALMLMGTLSADEMIDPALEPQAMLYRLYHEEGVRVYRPKKLAASCRCSRRKIEGVLRRLPDDELEDLKTEEGVLEVTCEFCSRTYRFDDEAIAHLTVKGSSGAGRRRPRE